MAKKRIIWTNDDFDEWYEEMLKDGYDEEEITPELYHHDCEINLGDERTNLNIEVCGHIIAYANIGTWQGNVNGCGIIGSNVRDILSSNCDYCTWYCDAYNVRFDGIHHDGSNHYLYRVVETKEQAERLMDRVVNGSLTEVQFRKATKSLRPYVARVYGW